MNEIRVIGAAHTITERKAALSWLQEYGVKLTGKKDADEATVLVRLALASACPGAKEAAEVISAYARANLPKIVQDAISCCKNDIEMAVAAIREETDHV